MELKIFDNQIYFHDLTFNQVLGDVNSLSGTLEKIHLNLNDDISLYDNEKLLFNGIVIRTEQSLDGKTTFTAYDKTWKLKSIVPLIKHYNGWKLEEIFNGISNGEIKQVDPESRYIEIAWTSREDEDNNFILSGDVAGANITEKVKMTETNGMKKAKSIWNLDDKSVTWNEILSLHLENSEEKLIYPRRNIYIRDSRSNTLAALNSKNYVFAKKDNFGHFANGLLYNTPIEVKIEVPDFIKENAIVMIEGESMLDLIEKICKGPLFLWGTSIPFQADFSFIDDNLLLIKSVEEDPIITLTEGKEIETATYALGFENLANKITCITKDKIIIAQDQDSINNYGVFERYDEIDLSDAEADYTAAQKLKEISQSDEELRCSIYGILPTVGINSHIIIPTFRLDKVLTIQEVSTRIGQENIGKSDLTLSNKKPLRKWKIPFQNVREIELMKKKLLHR
jgi:hypothetical protein